MAECDLYTKDEVISMFTELQSEIKKKMYDDTNEYGRKRYNKGLFDSYVFIQEKINEIKANNKGEEKNE